jgi:hypothetical protein
MSLNSQQRCAGERACEQNCSKYSQARYPFGLIAIELAAQEQLD